MSSLFKESDLDSLPYNSTDAANYLNRLLQERGTVVYADKTLPAEYWGPNQEDTDDHKGILICVEPIAKDSAEKIVADLAEFERTYIRPAKSEPRFAVPVPWEIYERAKRLRGGK